MTRLIVSSLHTGGGNTLGASEINSCNVQIKIKSHVDVLFNEDASNRSS